MGPMMVVFMHEVSGQFCSMLKVEDEMGIEEILPNGPVESLYNGVLLGLAWLYTDPFNLILFNQGCCCFEINPGLLSVAIRLSWMWTSTTSYF